MSDLALTLSCSFKSSTNLHTVGTGRLLNHVETIVGSYPVGLHVAV